MKKPLLDNIWEYEITKNEGIGLQGYGYKLEIFKDGISVYSQSGFGAISTAQSSARDFFLSYEFGIEREY